MEPLKFAPWTSEIDLGFYSALGNLKLNHDRLDSAARRIHNTALTQDHVPAGFYRGEGYIRNYNTMDEYKQVDKAAHIERAGRTIWDAINDGTIFSCPSLLSSFSAICYADLKKFKFTYQFAYPALHSDPTWSCSTAQKISPKETLELVDKHDHKPDDTPDYRWKIAALANYETGFFNDVDADDQCTCFADPSTFESNPGWMLRDLLVLVRQRWRLEKLHIMCHRETQARPETPHAIFFEVESVKPTEGDHYATFPSSPEGRDSLSSFPTARSIAPSERVPMPDITAWDRDTRSTNSSPIVNMGVYIWSSSSGVHALSVTRCLIGLEVRKITFVGNAKLSYSNPYYVITASARMSMSEAEANRNGKGNGRGNGEGQDRG
ncbi:E1-like protein-activating [Aureobasidium pullulans]|uniref:E1-like protein-activating n=1 Tax=Aureobasidium pullulans TaxID=5580 RepID=A0A4S8X3E6_AURPU|nr:E1-like protein-activating [Aureobasidium pullulans]